MEAIDKLLMNTIYDTELAGKKLEGRSYIVRKVEVAYPSHQALCCTLALLLATPRKHRKFRKEFPYILQ